MVIAVNMPYWKQMHIDECLPKEILGADILDTYITVYAQCFVPWGKRLSWEENIANLGRIRKIKFLFWPPKMLICEN